MKTHLRTLIVLLWTAGCSGSTDGGEPIAPTYTLTVTIAGQGNGEGTLEGDARLGDLLPCRVKNGVATAANGAACRLSHEYSGSGTFTLTGAPNGGSTFGGWNGCSSGSSRSSRSALTDRLSVSWNSGNSENSGNSSRVLPIKHEQRIVA
jgi:hypothetical protein